MTLGTLRQPLRMLLLPARLGREAKCAQALKKKLRGLNISSEDFSSWVELQISNWRSTGTPSRDLKEVAHAVIFASTHGGSYEEISLGSQLAKSYFPLHSKLMKEHLMSHTEASALLSHSFFIINLSHSERLSAAQIARLLHQRDHRANFSRQNVATTLQEIGISRDFNVQQTSALFRRDAAQESYAFADADFLTAAITVAEAGTKLGAEGDILRSLRTLAPRQNDNSIKSRYTPYLQMLHYQCTIAEFSDHALTNIYEFKPRGDRFKWLQEKYPHSIAGAGNAFLNNAKSVDVLDLGWVRSKKTQERPGAMALLTILESMEAMGFAARRELAWWIRLWLHRIIRVAATTPIYTPSELNREQIERILSGIASGNTKTFGILEQRSIDAISACVHKTLRARGLGDPVNATNISSAKFGDCEFLDINRCHIYAYESHGGRLSQTYVEQHLATIRKSIDRRIDELKAISDIENWNISIIFIAHALDHGLPKNAQSNGLNITIKAITFSDFFRETSLIQDDNLLKSFTDYLLTPIRTNRNPNAVREALLSILANKEA